MPSVSDMETPCACFFSPAGPADGLDIKRPLNDYRLKAGRMGTTESREGG
jgi:hypothetical protein